MFSLRVEDFNLLPAWLREEYRPFIEKAFSTCDSNEFDKLSWLSGVISNCWPSDGIMGQLLLEKFEKIEVGAEKIALANGIRSGWPSHEKNVGMVLAESLGQESRAGVAHWLEQSLSTLWCECDEVGEALMRQLTCFSFGDATYLARALLKGWPQYKDSVRNIMATRLKEERFLLYLAKIVELLSTEWQGDDYICEVVLEKFRCERARDGECLAHLAYALQCGWGRRLDIQQVILEIFVELPSWRDRMMTGETISENALSLYKGWAAEQIFLLVAKVNTNYSIDHKVVQEVLAAMSDPSIICSVEAEKLAANCYDGGFLVSLVEMCNPESESFLVDKVIEALSIACANSAETGEIVMRYFRQVEIGGHSWGSMAYSVASGWPEFREELLPGLIENSLKERSLGKRSSLSALMHFWPGNISVISVIVDAGFLPWLGSSSFLDSDDWRSWIVVIGPTHELACLVNSSEDGWRVEDQESVGFQELEYTVSDMGGLSVLIAPREAMAFT